MLDASLPLTVGEWEEWGDPDHDPDAYRTMKSCSPYDNVVVDERRRLAAPLPRAARRGRPQRHAGRVLGAGQVGRRSCATRTPRTRRTSRPTSARATRGPSGRYDSWRDEARVLSFVVSEIIRVVGAEDQRQRRGERRGQGDRAAPDGDGGVVRRAERQARTPVISSDSVWPWETVPWNSSVFGRPHPVDGPLGARRAGDRDAVARRRHRVVRGLGRSVGGGTRRNPPARWSRSSARRGGRRGDVVVVGRAVAAVAQLVADDAGRGHQDDQREQESRAGRRRRRGAGSAPAPTPRRGGSTGPGAPRPRVRRAR